MSASCCCQPSPSTSRSNTRAPSPFARPGKLPPCDQIRHAHTARVDQTRLTPAAPSRFHHLDEALDDFDVAPPIVVSSQQTKLAGHARPQEWLSQAPCCCQTDLNGDGKPEIITTTQDCRLQLLKPQPPGRPGDGFAAATVLAEATLLPPGWPPHLANGAPFPFPIISSCPNEEGGR